MKGQTTWVIVGAVVLVILGAAFWWYTSGPSSSPVLTQPPSEEANVDEVVTGFGTQLQMVSLMASSSVVAGAVEQYYAPYVDSELLQMWEASSTLPPGRLTSSPWPDRIDITSTDKNADGSYTVQGNVVEVTSAEGGTGSVPASTYPVKLRLEKKNGAWFITDYKRTDL